MRSGTLPGIILGTIAIFGAFYLEGGTLSSLWVLPAIIIVFGGTFAAAITGSSIEHVAKLPRLVRVALGSHEFDKREVISQVVMFAGIARREGILGMDKHLAEVHHPFLKKLLRICIDGAEPEVLTDLAETEIEFITARHQKNIQLFTKMGGYSPTMGIIGTVMGLISTLASVGGDPNTLIRHIASAFIATMWGIFMANIVWLPLADRLRMLHNEELELLRVMVEGVHALQLGETPSLIYSRLLGSLPLSEQAAPEPKKKVQQPAPAPNP